MIVLQCVKLGSNRNNVRERSASLSPTQIRDQVEQDPHIFPVLIDTRYCSTRYHVVTVSTYVTVTKDKRDLSEAHRQSSEDCIGKKHTDTRSRLRSTNIKDEDIIVAVVTSDFHHCRRHHFKDCRSWKFVNAIAIAIVVVAAGGCPKTSLFASSFSSSFCSRRRGSILLSRRWFYW